MTDPITITLTSEEVEKAMIEMPLRPELCSRWEKVGFLLAAKIRAAQAPSYTRVQVLRGEWEPKKVMKPGFFLGIYENFYAVYQKGEISHYEQLGQGNFLAYRECGEVFAPTRELAEELSQVIQGNWLPKAGDYYFCCGSSEENYSFKGREEIRRTEFNFTDSQMHEFHYFPSEAQRTTFIKTRGAEQVKKEEPKKFFCLNMVGGLKFTVPNDCERGNVQDAIDQLNAMLNFCRERGMKE